MRLRLINFFKRHKIYLRIYWTVMKAIFVVLHVLIPVNKKKIAFTSLGGRKFDDSPKAIYDYMCGLTEFDDYEFVWFFMDTGKFDIPRGKKVKIDTVSYIFEMLSSRVWISNSGMDRGIGLHFKNIINVDTWHGTPLKRMGEDINTDESRYSNWHKNSIDRRSIRCAQSEYDAEILSRVFRNDIECYLLCGLPRNDALLQYSESECVNIKKNLGININKKVILYTPTYREYAWDQSGQNYIAPPITMEKWKSVLGDQYVLLFRAHYAVTASLSIDDDDFVKNVTDYPILNDLYIIADMMISDYSSTFFDYSILDRPMFCFAYDYEEYTTRRGLYMDTEEELPCAINRTEDELLEDIVNMNYGKCVEKTKAFHAKYAPHDGEATRAVVEEIEKRLKIDNMGYLEESER